MDIMIIDPTGSRFITVSETLPQVADVYAVDHTGTNFIVDDDGNMSRVSLTNPSPVLITGEPYNRIAWW